MKIIKAIKNWSTAKAKKRILIVTFQKRVVSPDHAPKRLLIFLLMLQTPEVQNSINFMSYQNSKTATTTMKRQIQSLMKKNQKRQKISTKLEMETRRSLLEVLLELLLSQ